MTNKEFDFSDVIPSTFGDEVVAMIHQLTGVWPCIVLHIVPAAGGKVSTVSNMPLEEIDAFVTYIAEQHTEGSYNVHESQETKQ